MTRRNISSRNPFEEEFAYSRAVRVGDHVHVAGTCAPIRPTTREARGGAAAVLHIIAAALSEAGGLKDVVRTVVYVTDKSDMKEVARATTSARRRQAALHLGAGGGPVKAPSAIRDRGPAPF